MYDDQVKEKSPVPDTPQIHFNWGDCGNPKVFEIDQSVKFDNDQYAVYLDINSFNSEDYVATVSEFEKITIHNKFLYLQKTILSFVNVTTKNV